MLFANREKFTVFFSKRGQGFSMPVCIKSGIRAKPLYTRIHNCGFKFVVAMWKLRNFFECLSFKITELLLFLGHLIPIWAHNLKIWPHKHDNLTSMQTGDGTTGVTAVTL